MKYKIEMTMEISTRNQLSEAGIEDYIGENLNQNNIDVEVDAIRVDDPNILGEFEEIEHDRKLKDFHDHCHTQICTMNHMDNTDWEKGYMAGIRFGRKMANRFFSTKEETK